MCTVANDADDARNNGGFIVVSILCNKACEPDPGRKSKLLATVRARVVHSKRLQADSVSAGRTRTSLDFEIPRDLFDDVSDAHCPS